LAGEEEEEGEAEWLPPPAAPQEKYEAGGGEERPSLPPSLPPSWRRRRKETMGCPARSCRKVLGWVLLLLKEARRGGRKGEAPPRGAICVDRILVRPARWRGGREGGRKGGREGGRDSE
jgi:hypothetical protein